jgi:hypothetical protein
MTVAETTDVILVAPLSFLLGVFLGLVLSSRYLIVRRNGGGPPP